MIEILVILFSLYAFINAVSYDSSAGEIHQNDAYHRNGIALADAVGIKDEVDIVLPCRNIECAEQIVHAVVLYRFTVEGGLPSVRIIDFRKDNSPRR